MEIETKPYIPIGSTDIEDYIHAELHHSKEKVRVFDAARFNERMTRSLV